MPYPDNMNFDNITDYAICSCCGVVMDDPQDEGDPEDKDAVCYKCHTADMYDDD